MTGLMDQKIDVNETCDIYLPYRYLYFIGMSEKRIGTTEDLTGKVNWEEVVEYRCFDEAGEIHGIMQPAGCRRTIHISDQKAAEEGQVIMESTACSDPIDISDQKAAEEGQVIMESTVCSGPIHTSDQKLAVAKKTFYSDKEFEDFIITEYPLIQPIRLSEKDDLMADTLIIKRYITYDDDGQGTIKASRCYGFTRKGGI